MREIFDFLHYVIDPQKVKALILLMQAIALLMLIGCRRQLGIDAERYEAEIAAMQEVHDAEIQQLTARAESGIYATQYLPQEHQSDAWTLAQWLDCLDRTYPGITVEAKSLACWCVINRLESSEYPDNIEWVLLQPGQFCEFSADDPPTEDNMTIAGNQLSRYYNGDIRPAPERAVYITISSDGVVLRDTWEETSHTGYWRA